MTATTTDQIGDVVRPILDELGYDLEDVALRPVGGKQELRILVDRDGGASLDDLADVSRELSAALDDADTLGEQPYDLEVSTPGVTRPLTAPRHWRRGQGRKVKATTSDGDVTGRIGPVDGATVTLIHNNKGRITTTELALDDVQRAVLEVEFNRAGPAELKACGLDDDEIARRRTTPV